MTRAESIASLRARYAQAIRDKKHKQAGIIYARLSALVQRQLDYENRKDRRAAA